MTTENQLEKFRVRFPLNRVLVEADYMIYKIGGMRAREAAVLANELIDEMELNLVAIPKEIYPYDSVVVKIAGIEL